MSRFLLFALLVIGPAWSAKLPFIPNVPEGRDRFALSNDLLASYLPPTTEGPCVQPTVTQTAYETVTSTTTLRRPGPKDEIVTITSTQFVPTTIYRETGSVFNQVQTVVSTSFRTIDSTRVVTSTYEGQAATRTITNTVTRVSSVFDYVTRTTTQIRTQSNVVTQTMLSTELIYTTYTETRTQQSTRFISQTLPGQTIFVTRTSTYRDITTKTSPPRTRTIASTITQTRFQTRTERLPALVETVYKTSFDTRTSTVLSTFRDQQTTFVTSTAFITNYSTRSSVSTQKITNTLTSYQVVTNTVFSTVVSTRFTPTTITQQRASTSVVRIPADTIFNTVTRTETVGGRDQVTTSFRTLTETRTNTITRTVGGGSEQITITATERKPCAGTTGYRYDEPEVPFQIRG